MAGLTLKQQKFADEYIISGNIYQSAVKAGYSKAYAKGNASRLMENVSIKAYLDDRLEEIKSEKIADQQEVMEFLTAVMRGEVTEPVSLFVGDGVQEVNDLKPNVSSRKAAAELIGKRYAMWTDKAQTTNITAVTIVDDIDDE